MSKSGLFKLIDLGKNDSFYRDRELYIGKEFRGTLYPNKYTAPWFVFQGYDADGEEIIFAYCKMKKL